MAPPLAPEEMDRLLRRLDIPTCTELEQRLREDDALDNAQRLQAIEEHRQQMRQVCREYALMKRMVATGAAASATVEGCIQVGREMLNQLRIQCASTLHDYIAVLGITADDPSNDDPSKKNADFQRCWTNMRATCAQLEQYEAELRRITRLPEQQQAPSAAWRALRWVGRTLQGTAERIAQAAAWATKKGVSLLNLVLPILVRYIMYILHSPRAAVMALVFVRHAQRRLCRNVVQWWYGQRQGLRQADVVADVAGHAADHARAIGPAAVMKAGGKAIRETMKSMTPTIAEGIKGLAVMSLTGVTALNAASATVVVVGTLVYNLVQASCNAAGEAMADAAEFAAYGQEVSNSFAHFFAFVRLEDCIEEHRKRFGPPKG